MTKAELAHAIVSLSYSTMPVYHDYREKGYGEQAAKYHTEQWMARAYTKQELKEAYENI